MSTPGDEGSLRMHKMASVLLSWVFLVPVGLEAQVVEATSVSAAVRSVREGRVSSAADFLANKGGGVSGAEKSTLADSLVVIATSYRAGDPRVALQAANAAMTVVSLAVDASRGTPFPHAFETLVRIYEGSPEVRIQGTTLILIGSLPSEGRAVQFLSDIAVMPDGAMPSFAVRTLSEEAGQPGLNELRRLFDRKTVLNSRAKELLASVAHRKGWGS